jgi:murein DD-endopeptidase MepM/ murein hydrolase activator NlpD
VQPGDTLENLAAYYQTTVKSIQQENNLKNDSDLRIGDVIHIPVGRMDCPPTPTPRRVTPSPEPTSVARPPTTIAPLQERDCFPWDTANTFLGQVVCIGGWVVGAEDVQGTVYLYFGSPPESHFRVAIPADSRGNFPGDPLQLYNGRHILVRGRVESTGQVPLIVLRSPANLRVLE